ncbi:unnamed protein product [Ophioblennius macclurei]
MRMRRTVSVLLTVYVSVPVILYLFPWILGHFIYAHLVRFPFFVDLSQPEGLLNHTRNFYLDTEEGVSVGVWHTLPAGQWEEPEEKNAEWYQKTLGYGQPVIIYLHGNVGTRAIHHRIQLVKILSAAGFHVFSLDYRGFGDSSGEPSEAGLTHDAFSLYRWVKKHSPGSLVCLWGHSLGTGVATNSAVKILEQGSAVDALILEAPYTRIGEVVVAHPLSKLYTFFPGSKSLLWNILERNNIVFANDDNLKILSSPLLILHAEDDNIVPHHMGLKLYEVSRQAQRERHTDVPVEMISYKAELGYSHNFVYLDPDLPDTVTKFLQKL